jgi:ABC-type transport system involved in multi-copper enzyme maturation permease subunit
MNDTIAEADRLEPLAVPSPSYGRYVYTFFIFTMLSLLRQRRVILGGVVTLIPVIIPVSMAFFSEATFAEEGAPVFVKMMELLYLKAIVPLLALFFGCMLIGDDIESQTMPFMLTRPMPRGAYVLGRYLAYVVITTAVLTPSIAMTFAGCTSLADFNVSSGNVMLMLHYCLIAVLGLMAYGAICMFLGGTTKRPIVIGVIFLIPWQRIALRIPGYVDFVTVEKYMNIMMPVLPTQRGNPIAQQALGGLSKQEVLISPTAAAITLVVLSAVFVVMTQFAVRWREFSQAKAVGG